MCGKKEMHKGL